MCFYCAVLTCTQPQLCTVSVVTGHNQTSYVRFQAEVVVPESDVHVTVHRDTFLIIKPTRCTNFSNLFWIEILRVLDSSSVHHQEFFTEHTAMVYVIQVC